MGHCCALLSVSITTHTNSVDDLVGLVRSFLHPSISLQWWEGGTSVYNFHHEITHITLLGCWDNCHWFLVSHRTSSAVLALQN